MMLFHLKNIFMSPDAELQYALRSLHKYVHVGQWSVGQECHTAHLTLRPRRRAPPGPSPISTELYPPDPGLVAARLFKIKR